MAIFKTEFGLFQLQAPGNPGVTNRHPEMPFFPKTATQKKSIQVLAQDDFFHLIRSFQKHPKVSTYLIKEHLDVKKGISAF